MSGFVEDTFDFAKQIVNKAGDSVKDLGGSITKPFKPKPPEPPQAPGLPGLGDALKDPTTQSPEIKAAVDQQRKRLRAARGRQSTILTRESSLGEPATDRKTILGG